MILQGRVALITGGARRIGHIIAMALASRGAQVVISYQRSSKAAIETVGALRDLGVKAEAMAADVASASDVSRLFQRIERNFGRLDALINNASIFERTPFDRLTERDWDRHLDINLKGAFLCSLSASRLLRKRPQGKIVNIADWAGDRPYRDYLPYCVSKAGLIALTKALAKELAPGIQVVAIAPGPMLAPEDMLPAQRRAAVARLPLKRWGSPEDVANAVLFAIEGSDFLTGTTIYVDGGRSIA